MMNADPATRPRPALASRAASPRRQPSRAAPLAHGRRQVEALRVLAALFDRG